MSINARAKQRAKRLQRDQFKRYPRSASYAWLISRAGIQPFATPLSKLLRASHGAL